MSYYAEFKRVGDHWFRYDTRIYLKGEPKSQNNGRCVAAVIGKNPGSAKPSNGSGWQPLNLDGDQMLPRIRKWFRKAYDQVGTLVPELAYVQVLNLFYLCDPDIDEALKIYDAIENKKHCEKEEDSYDFVWFAWGGPHVKLDKFKNRFLIQPIRHAFFYDHSAKQIAARVPALHDFAGHPQRLKAAPVVNHLTTLL